MAWYLKNHGKVTRIQTLVNIPPSPLYLVSRSNSIVNSAQCRYVRPPFLETKLIPSEPLMAITTLCHFQLVSQASIYFHCSLSRWNTLRLASNPPFEPNSAWTLQCPPPYVLRKDSSSIFQPIVVGFFPTT